MICISWGLPSSKQQSKCLARSSSEGFNTEKKFLGSTKEELFTTTLKEELQKNGYFINNVCVYLGKGEATYLKAKESLKSWRHFQLGWTSVDSSTPVKVNQRFLVRVNELLVAWLLQPLEIEYVHDSHASQGQATQGSSMQNKKGFFAFGSGTLKGHLLENSSLRQRFTI
ncbi:hypothetical protein KP509_1Z015300 [Ceratopteris richardii]|nr:hypothetical protein KP509_1Z015300 [Ceratopteris richardii]